MTAQPAAPFPFKDLPEGTVTFLFSDIEGSTQLLYRLGDQFSARLAEHHRILRAALPAKQLEAALERGAKLNLDEVVEEIVRDVEDINRKEQNVRHEPRTVFEATIPQSVTTIMNQIAALTGHRFCL